MNRSDLIEELATRKNLPIHVAEKIILEIFSSMANNLKSGNRIEIRGFGSFEIREYEEYTGRNPKTGIDVTIKPKKLPFFKTGKELKDRILAAGNLGK